MTLLKKLRAAHARHCERHRPSGFGFAIADHIDYLDGRAWDELTARAGFFLSRSYLRVLENTGPDNLQPRYALIFRGAKPVAAVVMQVVTSGVDRVFKGPVSDGESRRRRDALNLLPAARKAGAALREKFVVCGNLLSWSGHGAAFAPGERAEELWPAIAELLYRVRRAEGLDGHPHFVVVKDVFGTDAAGIEALRRFSYRPAATPPDMVLEIPSTWRGYEDYLGSLTSEYRRAARKVAKDFEDAGGSIETLTDLAPHAARLHELYLAVHENNALRMATITPEYLPALAQTAGDAFRCTVAWRDGKIVGFVTTLRERGDGSGVNYYLGFDRAAANELPVYLRLLHTGVADAIALGCRKLSMGRTALEPKARLGARAVPMTVWVRHRQPVLNVALRGLWAAIQPPEAPERNPFKASKA